MASQITHVLYGKKFLDKDLSDQEIDKQKFYVGTLFPDIRYLGSIGREVTHRGESSIAAIRAEQNDFEKGRLVHCWVDFERENVVQNLQIYQIVPQHPMIPAVIKYLEDEVIYPLVENWPEIQSYLSSNVLSEETSFVDKDVVLRWRKLLAGYFSQPPTLDFALKAATSLTLSPEQLSQAKSVVESLRSNKEVITRIKMIYGQLFAQ